MEELAHEVREAVATVVGDGDLRVVSYYSEEDREVAYIRDDVREQYSEQVDVDVLETALLETTARTGYEELFGGEIRATTRVFDDTLVTIAPAGDHAGVLFSLERDGDYSYRDVVARVEAVVCD